jgi:hypothetical protein
MPVMKNKSTVLVGLFITIVVASSSLLAQMIPSNDEALIFDPEAYMTLDVSVDGEPMEVRQYQVVYVANPVRMAENQPGGRRPTVLPDPYAYQSMNIFVPQIAYESTNTAIILYVGNSGWRASMAPRSVEEGGAYVSNSDTDRVGAALKAGYVIASAGTRSRGAVTADDSWGGKAPAAVVDAKAAIRYLRLNDAVMSGSAERVIITGSSGGGALSVAVAASGNSPDYQPYLAAIGAAGIDEDGSSSLRDDVFATIAYCPITDLGHSDAAYEWQYNAVRDASNNVREEYTEQMQEASLELALSYPNYLAGLGLRLEDGTQLTGDNMADVIVAHLKRETEEAIAEGVEIPAIGEDFVLVSRFGSQTLVNDWLRIENGQIADIDYELFLRFVIKSRALKTVPGFDTTASTGNRGGGGENTLFGPDYLEYSNFTEYAWNNNEVKGDGTGLDDIGQEWSNYIIEPTSLLDTQLKMVNPMPYLGTDADSAPYWYVRHGMVDRDTAFALQVALYYAIVNDPSVEDVSFELAWLKPHGGNYDVQEAYSWIAAKLAEDHR